MKTKNRILLAAAAATMAGIFVYAYTQKRIKKNKQRSRVADEGYETAHDVLFPNSRSKRKRNYGQEYTL